LAVLERFAVKSQFRAPKKIRAEGHGATLIGLFEQLSCSSHTILPQRVTILVAKYMQYFQTRAYDQRYGVKLICGYFVVVQCYRLTYEFVGYVFAVFVGYLAEGLRTLQKKSKRQFGGKLGFY
jgi:hypothetical protein